jgi:type IV secretory pathway protease TraF
MRDIANNIGVAQTLAPVDYAATTKGTAVDLQGFNSAAVIVNTGAITTAGLYVVKVQESDTTTDGDFTDVVAGDLVGTLPASLAATSTYKQGYLGNKRYIRAVITKTSGTSIVAGAIVVKGNAADKPVA